MFPRIGIALLLVGAASPSAICLAKPADLPGDVTQQCLAARDGQQIEGFSQRPDAVEALPVRTAPMRTREQPRNRPVRDTDSFEEQDAPSARVPYRDATERRHTTPAPAAPLRDTNRRTADDDRRQEMLRSTQPLDTLPQRPVAEVIAETVQYYEVPPKAFTGPFPAPHYEDSSLQPDDELSFLPESTRTNIRAYQEWKKLRIEPWRFDPLPPTMPKLVSAELPPVAQDPNQKFEWTPGFDFTCNDHHWIDTERRRIQNMRFPWKGWTVRIRHGLIWFDWPQSCVVRQYEVTIRGLANAPPPVFADATVSCPYGVYNAIVNFKDNAIGLPKAMVQPDAFIDSSSLESEISESRLVGAYYADAITMPIHDCLGRGAWFIRGRPLLIVAYPSEPFHANPMIRGFIDCDGPLAPAPIGDFPSGDSLLQIGIN